MYNNLKKYLINNNICVNNEYLDKYIELIELNINNKYIKGITQKHHIIPKYVFESNNDIIDNSKSNLVNLNYKDHILAHYYLALCSSGANISKNVLAIRFILNGKTLEEFNIEECDLNKYQFLYEESRKNIYERSHSVETNKKISETLMGRPSPNKGKIKSTFKKSKANINAKNKKLSQIASERVGEKNSFYGKKHSEHTKQLISEHNSKPVGMYDLNTKELLMEFKSLKDAAQYLYNNKITTSSAAQTRICAVCKLDTDYNRAYGYNWRYVKKCNDYLDRE